MYLLFIELHHDVIEQEELQEVIVAGKPQGSVELSGMTNGTPASGGSMRKRDNGNNNDGLVATEVGPDYEPLRPPTPQPSPRPEAYAVVEMSKNENSSSADTSRLQQTYP